MSGPGLRARPAEEAKRVAVEIEAPRVIRVALAGCGVVGSAVVELLRRQTPAATPGHGVRFELARVLVRDRTRPRPVTLDPDVLTTSVEDFLATPADVVIEAIGGLEPAGHVARTTLAAGRRFITANKALMAEYGPELAALAARNRTSLDFESAVAGCVPVVRLLRDGSLGHGIDAVRGILNGTTNYLLGRLSAGLDYEAALAEAQALGFAEADPARDVNGQDAADKLAILAWLAFGVEPRTLPLRRRGIVPGAELHTATAAAVGGVVKLVAEVVATPDGIVAAVEPVVVASSSELGRVEGERNVVVVESRSAGAVLLSGKGAGGLPTASAILADLRRSAAPVRATPAPHPVAADDPRLHRWLLRGARASLDALRQACDREGVEVDTIAAAAVDSGGAPLLAARCTWSGLSRVVRETGADVLWTRWEP